MALTPINYVVDVAEDAQSVGSSQTLQTSKTWRIDIERGRIGGLIDGEQAIRQYVQKVLITSRNRYLIYDGTYGEEIRGLIGSSVSKTLTAVEIPRLIREAVDADERIESVTNVKITQYHKDGIHVTFNVNTFDGVILEFSEVI